MANYIIHGYVGFQNTGDELICLQIVKEIINIDHEANITIVTSDCDFSKTLFKSTSNLCEFRFNFLSRFDSLINIEKVIKNIDICIVCGGLIQEYNPINLIDIFNYSGNGIGSYITIPAMAKALGKKVFYWAQGLGPVFQKSSLSITKFYLSLADVITLRDRDSFDLAKQLLKSSSNIYLDIDPVIDMEIGSFFDLGQNNKKDKNNYRVGINFRPWNAVKFLTLEIAKIIRSKFTFHNTEITAIPFDLNLDNHPISLILERLTEYRIQNTECNSISSLLKAFSSLDFFIGTRLHSLIIAMKMGIPTLAISYDRKTDIFCEKYNISSIGIASLITESDFDFCISKITENKATIQKTSSVTPSIFKKFLLDAIPNYKEKFHE